VAQRQADRIAVSAPEIAWTYRELDQRSGAVARVVLERDAADGEVVVLLMAQSALLIAAILGVLKAGRIYACLFPSYPRQQIRGLIEHSGAVLLLTDPAHHELALQAAPPGVRVEPLVETSFQPSSVGVALVDLPPAAGAWLSYTSGSTGAPKGVWQNHAGIAHHTDTYLALIEAGPEDRFGLLNSPALAAGNTPLFAALLSGATLCPLDIRERGPAEIAGWLSDQAITVYHAAPTVFRRMARAVPAGRIFPALRVVRLGGEPVSAADVACVRRIAPPGARLLHAYSSTETGLICALSIDPQVALADGRVPVGRPVGGAEVTLLNADGQPVSQPDEGRVVVRSAHLAQGYWRRPADTAACFRPDPVDPARRQFFSADWGRFRADGYLEHLGRIDDQIKLRGERVDLAEIEGALRQMDGVEDAMVTLPEPAAGPPALVAWVSARPGADLSPATCRRFLSGTLPNRLIPRRVIVRPTLPYTPSGKPDRRALASASTLRPAGSSSQGIPRDDIEKQISRIFESVLGLTDVGRDQNLFDLGADSLHALEVRSAINQVLGVELPDSALLEQGTVAHLAGLVAAGVICTSPSPLVELNTGRQGIPLFLVHGGHGHLATYGQLARRLTDRPVYGLQAPGLHGECWPCTRVPALARCYLREILVAAPSGPILLAGVCMGGLVSFELACQIQSGGREVGLVALIDTAHPDHGGRDTPLVRRIQQRVRDTFRMLRWRWLRAVGWPKRYAGLPAYRRFVAHMHGRARRSYRPPFYPGRIHLVLAADENHAAASDPRTRMRRHAAQTEQVAIPGMRMDLFVAPGVDRLAALLRSWTHGK
jgi:amino acid adenylation domain-containing protein